MNTIDIIIKSGKFQSINDVINSINLIIDLLKEDVIRTLAATGVGGDIDDYFTRAAEILKRNIDRKKHLQGIRKLLNCSDIGTGLNIILSKLRGQTQNEMLKDRKNSVQQLKSRYQDTVDISYDYSIDEEIELENLEKMDVEELKNGLKKVWEEGKFDSDFDLVDLKELCNKYNIDLYDIVNKKELELPNLGSYELGNGLKQGFFILEEV
jgi:hypothetical protein